MSLQYSHLSDQEKRIWDSVYASSYSKYGDAYEATTDADKAIYDLRYEIKQKNRRY